MQVVDRTKFDVKQVADLAVRVGVVADTVELEIDETKAGFGGFATEFLRFSELNSVGRGLNRVVPNFASVTHCIQEVR